MPAYCRTHPIRTAALIGALAGIVNVVVLEIGGVLHHNSRGALLLLAPFSPFGAAPTEHTIAQTSVILIVEFAVNILVDALLFAVPVAVIVLLVRAFRR